MENWIECKDCGEILLFKIDEVTNKRTPITCECDEKEEEDEDEEEEADEIDLRHFNRRKKGGE